MAYRVMLCRGGQWLASGIIETNATAAKEWWDAKAAETGIAYRLDPI